MAKVTVTTNRSEGKPTTVTTHKQFSDGSSISVEREQGNVLFSGRIVSTSRSDGK